MPTRRQALAAGTLFAVGLGGCLGGGEQSVAVNAFEYELVNNDEQAHVFNYAFETTDGLGEWTTSEVPANDNEVLGDRPVDLDAGVTLHCVVDATPVRRDLASFSDSTDVVLLEYGNDEDPRIIGLSDPDD